MNFAKLFGKKKDNKAKPKVKPPSVFLKAKANIESKVNEIYATSKVTQKILNNTKKPVEIEIILNKHLENIIFSSFTAKVGNSIEAKSKVIKTEKAEEKYSDSIASGKAAIFTSVDKYDKNKIMVNIGNLPPNEELTFISEFIQFTESSNNSNEYELFRNIPKLNGPEIKVDYDHIEGKLEIQTKNKITNIDKKLLSGGLTILEERKKENNKFLIKYRYNSTSSDYIPTNKICFNIEPISKPMIFSQNSKKNKEEKSFILNYMLKGNKKEPKDKKQKQKQDDIKLSPALFIFLIDQSGSMAGSPIKVASKALLLFLQSLPVGSYYQIIGFGSNYKVYDNTPKEYNQKNIKESIKIVEELKGNLGGTNIYEPLKYIYNSSQNYNKILLPRNIFLLTDGEIDNKKDTLNLIEKYSNDYSVYSFGMGNSFDEDLIKNAGIVGKGSYSFCKQIDGLNKIIASTLNTICVPHINDFKLDSSLDKLNLCETIEIPKVIIENRLYRLNYIIKEKLENKKINIKLEYKQNDEKFSNNYEIEPIELPIGDELSKLIIYDYLSKNKNLSNEEKIKLALKYQLFIEGTSLFAEIELDNKITEQMEHKEIIKETKEYKTQPDSIEQQIDNRIKESESRINNLESKVNDLVDEAKARIKSGDEAGAKRLIAKKEKYIEQIKQIEGSISMMEEQKMMLENNSACKDVMSLIKNANCVVKDASKGMSIEELDEMKDDMEMKADQEELNDFFKEYEEQDQEDKYAEELEMLKDQMRKEGVDSLPKANLEPNNQNIINNEEDDLNQFLADFSESPQPKINEEKKEVKKEIKKEEKKETKKDLKTNLDKDGVMKIINTQNFIEGFWDINDSTNIIKAKYEKEFKLLKDLKEKKIDDIIAMTIIIIYFINKEHQELVEELVMILKKAKLYIQDKAGDSYENIINKVGIK